MNALLGGRQPRLVRADLAEDAGADPRLPHPVRDFADELVGQVVNGSLVDARLDRVVGVPIPPAAHHDVEAARPRKAREPARVATNARQRQVSQGAATGGPESFELGEDDRLIAGQLPVVPPVLDVPQRDLGVFVGQREAEIGRLYRPEHRLDMR